LNKWIIIIIIINDGHIDQSAHRHYPTLPQFIHVDHVPFKTNPNNYIWQKT